MPTTNDPSAQTTFPAGPGPAAPASGQVQTGRSRLPTDPWVIPPPPAAIVNSDGACVGSGIEGSKCRNASDRHAGVFLVSVTDSNIKGWMCPDCFHDWQMARLQKKVDAEPLKNPDWYHPAFGALESDGSYHLVTCFYNEKGICAWSVEHKDPEPTQEIDKLFKRPPGVKLSLKGMRNPPADLVDGEWNVKPVGGMPSMGNNQPACVCGRIYETHKDAGSMWIRRSCRVHGLKEIENFASKIVLRGRDMRQALDQEISARTAKP